MWTITHNDMGCLYGCSYVPGNAGVNLVNVDCSNFLSSNVRLIDCFRNEFRSCGHNDDVALICGTADQRECIG